MARRRRGEEERKPDLGFEVPDFDEDEFIRKETISFRTTLILFLYSVGTAFVTFLIWAATPIDSWFAALLIGGVLGAALRWIYPALKVDVSHFGRKEWTGTGLLYFFSWLAFFIFFVNPPIYDGVAPELQVHITPDAQTPGGTVDITLFALDNVAIDESSVTFTVRGPDGTILATTEALRSEAHAGAWNWEQVLDTPGEYTVEASVRDTGSGWLLGTPRTDRQTATFRIDTDALQVFFTGESLGEDRHRFKSPDDSVRVQIPNEVDVYRAWLALDGGNASSTTECVAPYTECIPLRHDADDDTETHEVWRAHPNFAGFREGNNTFHVYVKEHDSYWLEKAYGLEEPQSPLVSAKAYTVVIDDAQLLGDVTPRQSGERSPEPLRTPGPGIALTLVGVLVVAVLMARRRRDP